MKDSPRWVFFYFFVAAFEGLLALVYMLALPADPKNSVFLGYSLARLIMIAAALSGTLLCTAFALKTWKGSTRINALLRRLGDSEAAFWCVIFLSLGLFGASPGLLISGPALTPEYLARLTPILLWVSMLGLQTLVVVVFWAKASQHLRRHLALAAARLLSLGLPCALAIPLLGFLFPRETSWLVGFAVIILLYGLAEEVLWATGRIDNFFELADEGHFDRTSTAFATIVPLAFSAVVSLLTQVPLTFVLGWVWLALLLQSYLNYAFKSLFLGKRSKAPGSNEDSRLDGKKAAASGQRLALVALWLAALLIVAGQAILTLRPFEPGCFVDAGLGVEAPNLIRTYDRTGLWFVQETTVSQQYPLGLARGGGVDTGWAFICILATKLGTSDVALSWVTYITAALLMALFSSILIYRSPAALFALGVSLLVAVNSPLSRMQLGTTWGHMSVTEMTVLTLVFISILPYAVRGWRISHAAWYALLTGLVAGFCLLTRQSDGMAAMLAGVVIIFVFGLLKHRRLAVSLAAMAALLLGVTFMRATLKTVLWYRDDRAQITALNDRLWSHGAWYPLLGGLGGGSLKPDAYVTPYDNALDMAFDDGIILSVILNENPLVMAIPTIQVEISQVSQQIYMQYVSQHPLEYINIQASKALQLWRLLLENVVDQWGSFLLALLATGALGLAVQRLLLPHRNSIDREHSLEQIGAGLCFFGVSAIVPILIEPRYVYVWYETGSIFLFTGALAVYAFLFGGHLADHKPQPSTWEPMQVASSPSWSARASRLWLAVRGLNLGALLPALLFLALWLILSYATPIDRARSPEERQQMLLELINNTLHKGDAVFSTSPRPQVRAALDASGVEVIPASPENYDAFAAAFSGYMDRLCANPNEEHIAYFLWTDEGALTVTNLGPITRIIKLFAHWKTLGEEGNLMELLFKTENLEHYCAARRVSGERAVAVLLAPQRFTPLIGSVTLGKMIFLGANEVREVWQPWAWRNQDRAAYTTAIPTIRRQDGLILVDRDAKLGSVAWDYVGSCPPDKLVDTGTMFQQMCWR